MNALLTVIELEARATATIAAGSKSFAMAAKLFAPIERRPAILLYAWCRACDDAVDGQTFGHDTQPLTKTEQTARLADLRQQTEAALAGKSENLAPVFQGLALVVKNCAIPPHFVHQHLDGFASDVAGVVCRDEKDLLHYCHLVAGVVGVLMTHIMGASDAATLRRAADLGIAFQLTNIARDIVDDARTGRCYLPQDWLAAAGLTALQLADPAQASKVVPLAQRLLTLAECYYDSAFYGVAALPWRSALAIAAARRIYRVIGRRVSARGANAWQTRTIISKPQQITLALVAIGDVIATRLRRRELLAATRPDLWCDQTLAG
jgi:15-cis-phytoene synthase